jgi:hypothetical protein
MVFFKSKSCDYLSVFETFKTVMECEIFLKDLVWLVGEIKSPKHYLSLNIIFELKNMP